jgi:hypothetical protein
MSAAPVALELQDGLLLLLKVVVGVEVAPKSDTPALFVLSSVLV